MEIDQRELGDGVLEVNLAGSLDVAGAAAIDTPLADIGASNDKVVINLSKVDFIASVGIRVLVRTAKAVAARGGKFAMFNPTEESARVLKATGLDMLMHVADDEAGAVAAVS